MSPLLDVTFGPEEFMAAWCFLIASFLFTKTCQYIYSEIKPRWGLYFWSALATSVGEWGCTWSALLQSFALVPDQTLSVTLGLAWLLMGTGNSMLLYSRLHLATASGHSLLWKKRGTAAIISASLLYTQLPAAWKLVTSDWKAKTFSSISESPFQAHERAQTTAMVAQETFILVLFMHGLYQSWKLAGRNEDQWVRQENVSGIQYFAFVLTIDLAVLVTEYIPVFRMLTATKSLIYFMKLFYLVIILNDSLETTQTTNLTHQSILKRRKAESL
ncbi:integral membrane protein [Apiospora arundinis]|uniref:Integral membrane protein n=1 Tax=Apiospora arundinis TaxID=335852 RepID=A0ABR2IWQ4_9PEZI